MSVSVVPALGLGSPLPTYLPLQISQPPASPWGLSCPKPSLSESLFLSKMGPEQARMWGRDEGKCPPKELSKMTRDPITFPKPALVKTRPL